MSQHFHREVEKLKKRLLALSAEVEEVVHRAVKALEEHDATLARSVIDYDIEIDHKEVEIEEEVLKILALYQPVAVDLRYIMAVLKINTELERTADCAVNIAERAIFLSQQPKPEVTFDFANMAEKAKAMLRRSLDALVNMDARLAREVLTADDEIDTINQGMYEQVKDGIRRNIGDLDALIHLLSVSRHLERIGDLASNIAEDVIYTVEGEIVRHRSEDYTQ